MIFLYFVRVTFLIHSYSCVSTQEHPFAVGIMLRRLVAQVEWVRLEYLGWLEIGHS